jgi:uridine kinase
MDLETLLSDRQRFSEKLYELMCQVNVGITGLELYEFRYALTNITPAQGWNTIVLSKPEELETQISDPSFFKSIQFKPLREGRIVLDEHIAQLTQMLFVGLVSGTYPLDWVNAHFYFDIRAFIFLVRTRHYDQAILEHFGGQPYLQFDPKQKALESKQDLGYRELRLANQAVDEAFIAIVELIIKTHGTPLLLTLVGPTGAGKTEIIQRMQEVLSGKSLHTTSIEMDNFYKDGAFREGKVLDQNLIHYELFIQCMQDIQFGRQAITPRYNFLSLTSSHDMEGILRPGLAPLVVSPADVVFLEGNYPFHQPEVASLVGLKIVYLTDDDIRLKRKWRRDIDYRKKYEPVYFVNRYFRTQAIRAEAVYRPLIAVCDMLVDTSAATIWLTKEMRTMLGSIHLDEQG